jgi:hypothetical protein
MVMPFPEERVWSTIGEYAYNVKLVGVRKALAVYVSPNMAAINSASAIWRCAGKLYTSCASGGPGWQVCRMWYPEQLAGDGEGT